MFLFLSGALDLCFFNGLHYSKRCSTNHDNISGVSSRSHGRSWLQASQARCDPRADTDTSIVLDADESNKGAAEFWRIPPTSGGLIESQKCGGVSQNDGGRTQIYCLAQDQSQDKVINLKQDVSPLTLSFIFRVWGCVGGSGALKIQIGAVGTAAEGRIFGTEVGSPPCTEKVETASPAGSHGGWDIFLFLSLSCANNSVLICSVQMQKRSALFYFNVIFGFFPSRLAWILVNASSSQGECVS